jgi:hypothetical protein
MFARGSASFENEKEEVEEGENVSTTRPQNEIKKIHFRN